MKTANEVPSANGDEYVENLFKEIERVWIHNGQVDLRSAKYLAKIAYDEGVKEGMTVLIGDTATNDKRPLSHHWFAG